MYLIAVIVTIAVLWILQYMLQMHKLKCKLKDFTCPPENFLFGHLLDLNPHTDMFSKLSEYMKNHGRLLHLNASYFIPFLLITDRDVIKQVLTSSKTIDKGSVYNTLVKLTNYTLPTLNGEKWHTMRRLLDPVFNTQVLDSFVKIFNQAAEILVNRLENTLGKTVEFEHYLQLCTLDIAYETLFGIKLDVQSNEFNELNACTSELMQIMADNMFKPWNFISCIYIFNRNFWREKVLHKRINKFLLDIIEERRSSMHNMQVEGFQENKARNFADTLLNGEIFGRKMTDHEIMNEFKSIIFASRDTVGSLVPNVLHVLAHHSSIQDQVNEEMKTIFGDDMKRAITIGDTRNMKYLGMVINETLRKYTPAPFIGRKFNEDLEINGISIPANINVVFYLRGLHNDPEYFPNPEEFDPERFNQDNGNQINSFTFLPFSAGPRNCIGQRYAIHEMKTVLAYILRRYEILPVGNKELHMMIGIVSKAKDGIKIKFKLRDT